MNKVCIIIPTYNESKKIGGLLLQLAAKRIDVIVVDDGSSDRTADIAQKQGACVIRALKNRGKGAALLNGFTYALKQGYDTVITMDGDGQHDPEDIGRFFDKAEASGSSIIIGNRMSDPKNMPLDRWLTNKAMSWFISLLSGQCIPDSQCGFRLLKKDALEKLYLRTSNYETESEMLLKASRLGLKVESVSIKTIYKGERSRINPFTDTIRFLKLILREYGLSGFKKKDG